MIGFRRRLLVVTAILTVVAVAWWGLTTPPAPLRPSKRGVSAELAMEARGEEAESSVVNKVVQQTQSSSIVTQVSIGQPLDNDKEPVSEPIQALQAVRSGHPLTSDQVQSLQSWESSMRMQLDDELRVQANRLSAEEGVDARKTYLRLRSEAMAAQRAVAVDVLLKRFDPGGEGVLRREAVKSIIDIYKTHEGIQEDVWAARFAADLQVLDEGTGWRNLGVSALGRDFALMIQVEVIPSVIRKQHLLK